MALTDDLYVVDKSALARVGRPAVGEVLQPLFLRDALATCAIVDLEVQFSARSPADYERLRTDQRALRRLPLTEDTCERALDVQRRLAQRSCHRGASIPDLLIAACAEAHGVAVLHYDADFDLIAEVTGQSVTWVVARGTVD